MKFNLRLEGKEALARNFAAKPAQIHRAVKFTINEYTRLLTKTIGGQAPRVAETSVAGFRRVRTYRKLAKGRRKRLQGITWVGENAIAAIYGKGRIKKTKGGIKKGNRFYENAFVATMKSGHKGIFYRVGSKIKEATFEIEPQTDSVIRDVIGSTQPKIRSMLHRRLAREMSKKK